MSNLEEFISRNFPEPESKWRDPDVLEAERQSLVLQAFPDWLQKMAAVMSVMPGLPAGGTAPKPQAHGMLRPQPSGGKLGVRFPNQPNLRWWYDNLVEPKVGAGSLIKDTVMQKGSFPSQLVLWAEEHFPSLVKKVDTLPDIEVHEARPGDVGGWMAGSGRSVGPGSKLGPVNRIYVMSPDQFPNVGLKAGTDPYRDFLALLLKSIYVKKALDSGIEDWQGPPRLSNILRRYGKEEGLRGGKSATTYANELLSENMLKGLVKKAAKPQVDD